MAVGPVIEGKATRDVWFEVNGEVRAVAVEDKNSAVETFTREKATPAPGSVGAPMSGVVVEVRVKEGQEVKKGDVLCVQSAMKVCNNFPGSFYVYPQWERDYKIPIFFFLQYVCLSFLLKHFTDGICCQRACFWSYQTCLCKRRYEQ